MDQINIDDCVEIGYIQKPHGIKGELVLIFGKEFEETFEGIDCLFIEVDGGLVPFFIADEGFRFKSSESAICKFDFIDSQEKAKSLVGCKIFVPDEEVIETDQREVDSFLIGMKTFDARFGEIGTISRVDDYSGNLVITVDHHKTEVLIPLSDEIITSINEENRELHLDCPTGLIEIYLE